MSNSIDKEVKAYSRIPRIQAFDICATFGDGQPGRVEKLLLNKDGRTWLDQAAWEAGDVAYQCLKQLDPEGITAERISELASECYSITVEDLYPIILRRAEAGEFKIMPSGVGGLKAAWAEYDWGERVMFAYSFLEGLKKSEVSFTNPLNIAVPLILLFRLDDAVMAEFFDGNGLAATMIEIASLRDRIQLPDHVQFAIDTLQGKLDTFLQARRKGADAIHGENRTMKAEVFEWLNIQSTFKSIEAAGTAIIKQAPIAHVTAKSWYKEWKKLRSASTP